MQHQFFDLVHHFNTLGPIPHQSFDLILKNYRELMHLKFGSKSVLVASTSEMDKQFLKVQDTNFACHPLLVGGK